MSCQPRIQDTNITDHADKNVHTSDHVQNFQFTFTTQVYMYGFIACFNALGWVADLIERNSPRKPLTDFLTLVASWTLVTFGKVKHGKRISAFSEKGKGKGNIMFPLESDSRR